MAIFFAAKTFLWRGKLIWKVRKIEKADAFSGRDSFEKIEFLNCITHYIERSPEKTKKTNQNPVKIDPDF